MASALMVIATLPEPCNKLPIRSAASEPLAIVSIDTTASRPVWGASVATQTTGIFANFDVVWLENATQAGDPSAMLLSAQMNCLK